MSDEVLDAQTNIEKLSDAFDQLELLDYSAIEEEGQKAHFILSVGALKLDFNIAATGESVPWTLDKKEEYQVELKQEDTSPKEFGLGVNREIKNPKKAALSMLKVVLGNLNIK